LGEESCTQESHRKGTAGVQEEAFTLCGNEEKKNRESGDRKAPKVKKEKSELRGLLPTTVTSSGEKKALSK